MPFVGPRRSELAQLVTNHVLSDKYRDVLSTVVNGDRVSDHVRVNGGPARPGLDDLLLTSLIQLLNFFHQVVVDEIAFFDTSCH